MTHSFIVIAGNIGVGKSALTQLVAQRLGCKPFYEAFEENPYLSDFYQDMPQWSFHSQIFFLSQRLQHHHALAHFPGPVVQDRSVYEDAEIFAQNLYLQGNMSERDYRTYRSLYEGIRAFLPAPTLMVYLHASVGLLAERIALRGRAYEQQISIQYLQKINQLYDTWANEWAACPLLRLDAARYDFVNRADDADAIIQQLEQALVSEVKA